MSEGWPAAEEAAVTGPRSDGAWGSVLACQELAAVGSVGFAPAGQVFGAAVYAAGAASGSSCPGMAGAPGGEMPVPSAAPVPGRGDPGGFGPLVQAMYQARRAAVDRMTAECAALGGHGVVGVRLALGIAIGSRHDDRTTTRQARPWSGNAEVAGWTGLVNQTRQDARRRLEDDVRRLGAEGVVIAGMQMRARERDCPVAVGRRDHIVEVTLIGTAIASFSSVGHSHAGPALAVVPLGTRPRQAFWARQDRY